MFASVVAALRGLDAGPITPDPNWPRVSRACRRPPSEPRTPGHRHAFGRMRWTFSTASPGSCPVGRLGHPFGHLVGLSAGGQRLHNNAAAQLRQRSASWDNGRRRCWR